MKEKLLRATLFLVLSLGITATYGDAFDDGLSHYGKGDYPRAMSLLKPLAMEGDDAAQYYVGQMYWHGKGVNRDPIVAYAWVKEASDNGSDIASALLRDIKAALTAEDLKRAEQMTSNVLQQ